MFRENLENYFEGGGLDSALFGNGLRQIKRFTTPC